MYQMHWKHGGTPATRVHQPAAKALEGPKSIHTLRHVDTHLCSLWLPGSLKQPPD